MYVSSKPINITEVCICYTYLSFSLIVGDLAMILQSFAFQVMRTLHRLFDKFMENRKTQNIYQAHKDHVKPFGIFMSLLSHSMLGNYKQVMSKYFLTSISLPYFMTLQYSKCYK